MPETPPDNVSLLIGAEADRERRRSSQISNTPPEQVHRRLPRLFSGQVTPESEDELTNFDQDKDESRVEAESPGFLGRVDSYKRLMHAHTKTQMKSPTTGTVPSYKKTMRAFTLNQLQRHRRASKSKTSSPQIGERQVIPPTKLRIELLKLSEDEHPHGPSNTPERDDDKVEDVQGIDFRKLRRRSLTDPTVSRDFVEVKSRDFAAAAV